QQTRVGLRISKTTGLHLRANAATNSLDVVPIEFAAPQGLVTADVAEESDRTTIQLQVRGITSRSVMLSDGSSVEALIWGQGEVSPPPPVVSPLPPGVVVASACELSGTQWLLCNGQAVSRTTYAALFGALSTYYGAGDGSTTFNVPDYRGYFLRGSGTNSDGTASGTFGAKQGMATALPASPFTTSDPGNHTHTSPAADSATGSGPYHGEMTSSYTANIATSAAGAHTHTIGGGDAETRPKNIAVYYYIKT
ncbi:MAG: hypothetical protein EBS50_10360, partial [Sphingomonadaceae bacterium]|nr:hypothetical protein [Sphingomonadaceae bacterium]